MAAICTVNAIACVPPTRFGPDRDDIVARTASRESLAVDPQLVWRTDAGRAVRGTPAIGARVVAVGTSDRSVVLLDRASGQRIWRRHVPGTVAAGPVIRDSFVYVATQAVPDGRVLALRLKTGVPAWSARTGGVSAPLTFADSSLIAATDRGSVVALDPATGARRWERRLGRGIRAMPLVVSAGIAVATIGDSLYLLDSGSGAIRTRIATPGSVIGTPATDGQRIFAGTTAGHVIALALPDLTVVWDRPLRDSVHSASPLGDAIYGAPALGGDTLYAVTARGVLWRLPLAAPDSARAVDLGVPATAGPTPLANGIMIAGVTGDVLLVDAVTDAVRWRTRGRGPIDAAPVVKDRELFLVTGNGVVEAYR